MPFSHIKTDMDAGGSASLYDVVDDLAEIEIGF